MDPNKLNTLKVRDGAAAGRRRGGGRHLNPCTGARGVWPPRMQCALIPAEDSRPLFAPLPVFYVWLGTRGLGGAGCCSCGGKVGPADAH